MSKQLATKTANKKQSTSNITANKVEPYEKKTKLEAYIEVLHKVAYPKQSTFDSARDYAKTLNYLVEQGLIQKTSTGKTIAFSATKRGLTVLKYFSLIKSIPKILPH